MSTKIAYMTYKPIYAYTFPLIFMAIKPMLHLMKH